MTEAKESPIKYLDSDNIKSLYDILSETFKTSGEPIPPFSTANEHNLDSLVKIPKSTYFDIEQYPTIESKAAIIFYTINKKHIFLNANKRMSVLCLLVFLGINNMKLGVTTDELTEKALWLANTTHEHSFPEIKDNLEKWIRENIVSI